MSDVNKFDLDALDESALPEDVEINPDANPMEAPPPPDDGVYRVKLLPVDTTSIEVRESKGKKPTPYISLPYSGSVVAEGTKNNNKRIFGNVTTLVFEGKNEMAYIVLQARGGGPDAKAYVATLNNYAKLAKAFRDTLAGEPVIRVKGKWVASFKDETESAKAGKAVYKTFLTGQKSFPQNPDGSYKHVVLHRESGQEVAAKFVVTDYFPDVA